MGRAREFQEAISIAGILEGRSQGDRLYAMRRLKLTDSSAKEKIQSVQARVDAASLLQANPTLAREERHQHLLVLRKEDLSSAVNYGKSIIKQEVEEVSCGKRIFDAVCPLPRADRFNPLMPEVVRILT